MNLSVIFPMAGDGQRFGCGFKPFLDATEKKFIELAKEPFSIFSTDSCYCVTFVFIYRRDQEEKYNVESTLRRYFPNDRIKCCILEQPTLGPLDTVQQAIKKYDLSGSAFVCDCDHAIVLNDVYSYLSTTLPDILIPTWSYKKDEYASWGKVKMTLDRKAIAFYEKENVPFSDEYRVEGMIGCYFFKDVSILQSVTSSGNMSDVFHLFLDKDIYCMRITHAEFFGTPEQLISFRFDRARKYTFFVDIDGTLFHLPKHVPYESSDTTLLPGAIDKLTEWKQQGHTIVLTTGRETARRDKLIKQLSDLRIPYDQLVTGLASGTRIVINDKKPYCEFHKMSYAVQLRRNEGISHISIQPTPDIVRVLKGGSFATVYLINDQDTLKVRKYIEKRPELTIHVDTLRRQYEDLKRFAYLSPGLVPTVLSVYESLDEYYIDMEYLDGYQELSTCDDTIVNSVIPRVIQVLNKDIYCFSKPIDGRIWLSEFIHEKIASKYDMIASLGTAFYKAVHEPYIIINNTKVKGLVHYFKTESLDEFAPHTVSPIHGDLTTENILYHPGLDTFRLIDPSGSRYVDAREMDLAKLLQYPVARYHEWDKLAEHSVYDATQNEFRVHDSLIYLASTSIHELFGASKRVGLFYLCTYFIRMIPFLRASSLEKALTGLLFALYHLSQNRFL
jgi:hypothetical protein